MKQFINALSIVILICFLNLYVINCQIQVPPVPQPPPQLPTTQPPNQEFDKKPKFNENCKECTTKLRQHLGQWLLSGSWCLEEGKPLPETPYKSVEYPSYDGFFNNLAQPDLGAVDTPLLRRVPAVYEDGVYQPMGKNRPNPFLLSETIFKGSSKRTHSGKTTLLVFFGQQVVEEILDAQRPACPPEYFNIDIPGNHTYSNESIHTKMPFLRTRYDVRTGQNPGNPRQQLNEITPWIDGGLVYGTTRVWSDYLRRFSNGSLAPDGKLAWSHGGLFPAYNEDRLPMANPPPPFYHKIFVKNHETLPVNRFFKLGNPRGNENPFLLTFGVFWFRWHNYLAEEMRQQHPKWKSEQIYEEARKWTIATQQHIIVNNWLPHWIGSKLDKYTGYDPSINPQIDQLFQTAAFRFGHTLVPPGVFIRKPDNPSEFNFIRTCNSFWRPQDFIGFSNGTLQNIDDLIVGLSLQLCEREDRVIIEDLRERVFGPLEFSRRDLMALNIQRGRDHGNPDYLTARKAFGLHTQKEKLPFWSQLMKMYNNKEKDVDVWVGGMFETDDQRPSPGELFQAIIKDQFRRIRDGDRFWYKNSGNGLFSEKEIKRIEELTIYDILMAITQLEPKDIQTNPFLAPTEANEVNVNLPMSECRFYLNLSLYPPYSHANCYNLQVDRSNLEECSKLETYDYFSGSEIPFVITFLAISITILAFSGWVTLISLKLPTSEQPQEVQQAKELQTIDANNSQYFVHERIGKNSYRSVIVSLDIPKRQIKECSMSGELIRQLDMTNTQNPIKVFIISDGQHLLFRMCNEYDLIIRFQTAYVRSLFLKKFEEFVFKIQANRDRINISLSAALRQAITKKDRQRLLEKFFRIVFAQTFNLSHSDEIFKLDSQTARDIIYTELTKTEFADALSMLPDSEFVTKMFNFVDKDKNGFISFREFMDFLIIFAKGSTEAKAKMMFDMYDINGTQQLTKEDFKNMIKSLIEIVNVDVNPDHLNKVVDLLLQKAKLTQKDALRYQDFQQVLLEGTNQVSNLKLNFTFGEVGVASSSTGRSPSTFSLYSDALNDITPSDADRMIDEDQEKAMAHRDPGDGLIFNIAREKSKTRRHLGNYALEIFWLTLYTLILFAIFAERAYHYSIEREHGGLRQIASYGVTVTRGAASAIMFCLSSLLVPMCRNCITFLRDKRAHDWIPFDSAINFHKYVACWALFFIIVHIIGHSFNFYFISTQTSDDLTCLFRNFHHSTHEIPKFQYWCWGTITGVTGVFLTIFTACIYLFALPTVRHRWYNSFWIVHSLYPFYFLLLIFHGSGRLVQPPFFYYFFLGPCILFALDQIVSVSRKKVEIPVIKSQILPSGVTMLEIKRPTNFEYKSGQWVRVACPSINSFEYHPFTFSSAPHEENLTLHIRAVGSWTQRLRQAYDPTTISSELPKVILDGPYGESHQDWNQYEVAVLIGAGIGVTPFASILKEIVFRNNSLTNGIGTCRKVYFLWVTRTQKQFEWLVDIIRDVENTDKNHLVSVHIFITQFYNKFDLRTILLYICERRFQRVSNRSLFTGLQAVTHFGRPDFYCFFRSIQNLRPNVRKVGVFSCGPLPLTQKVNKACSQINKETHFGPIFQHVSKHF